MAKKVVATLKTGTGKQFTKCIKMVKSEKTGSYMFKEGVIAVVGGVVFLDEVADIDFMLPYTWCKCVPFCSHGRFLL